MPKLHRFSRFFDVRLLSPCCHSNLGLPVFHRPIGYYSNTCLDSLVSGIRCIWPYHVRYILFITFPSISIRYFIISFLILSPSHRIHFYRFLPCFIFFHHPPNFCSIQKSAFDHCWWRISFPLLFLDSIPLSHPIIFFMSLIISVSIIERNIQIHVFSTEGNF